MDKPCKKCGITDRDKAGDCKPCQRLYHKLNWEKKTRNAHLKRLYGITVDQYEEMFSQQNGLCLICEQAKKLVVDRCHETKKVRGLLCHNCNKALGFLKERISSLEKAIEHLRKNA